MNKISKMMIFMSQTATNMFLLFLISGQYGKKFLNINGDRFSGKTHLVKMFIKKFKGIKLDANTLNNENLEMVKSHQNIILENVSRKIDENLFYSLLNIIDLIIDLS